MCSFIFSTNTVVDLDKINTFNRRRGPDLTVRYKYHNYEFIHNLLSITGEFTKQPLIDDEYITLFNGEIYNHSELRTYLEQQGINFYSDHSDTEVLLNGFSYLNLINLYKTHFDNVYIEKYENIYEFKVFKKIFNLNSDDVFFLQQQSKEKINISLLPKYIQHNLYKFEDWIH